MGRGQGTCIKIHGQRQWCGESMKMGSRWWVGPGRVIGENADNYNWITINF